MTKSKSTKINSSVVVQSRRPGIIVIVSIIFILCLTIFGIIVAVKAQEKARVDAQIRLEAEQRTEIQSAYADAMTRGYEKQRAKEAASKANAKPVDLTIDCHGSLQCIADKYGYLNNPAPTTRRNLNTCPSIGACPQITDWALGYAYGYKNNICTPNYTGGKNETFNKGVQDWASDNCN